MWRRSVLFWILACVVSSLSGSAQEGHPLTGTWTGDWGPSASQRNHLTIVMNWDGKNVTGTINPGPDAVSIKNVALDVATWTIRLDAETKDRSGTMIPIAAEGRLEDIGSPHRRLTGSWREGTARGDFKVSRD
jgi:hypothetical protein